MNTDANASSRKDGVLCINYLWFRPVVAHSLLCSGMTYNYNYLSLHMVISLCVQQCKAGLSTITLKVDWNRIHLKFPWI